MMAPVSFDASTFELWGPLLNGGCLAILPPGEVTLDGLERAIHDSGVTTLWLTAGLFHLVVDERLAALAPLRQLLAGATCSRRRTSRACAVQLPGLRLVNGYGPTENTTFTTWHRVERVEGANVPIGRPIANTRVLVLGPRSRAGADRRARRALCRRRRPRARLSRPARADRRRLRPRAVQRAARASGSTARATWRAGCRTAASTSSAAPTTRSRCAASASSWERSRPLSRTIRRCARRRSWRCGTMAGSAGWWPGCVPREAWRRRPPRRRCSPILPPRLPAYMVPVDLIVARRPAALADRQGGPRRAGGAGDWRWRRRRRWISPPPRGAVEETPGGDLAAGPGVRAGGGPRQLLPSGRRLHPEHPGRGAGAPGGAGADAAADLRAADDRRPRRGRHAARRGRVGAGRGRGARCRSRPIQRYFLDARPAEPHHFNQSLLLLAGGAAGAGAAGAALAALVAHHDALRLRFVAAGRRLAGVERAARAERSRSPPSTSRRCRRRAAPARWRPPRTALQAGFDLARGPLFRAARFVLRRGDEPERLLLVAHHLVVDGVSWRILLEDLETAYGQARRRPAVALPAKTTSWKRWAERLAAQARSAGGPGRAAVLAARAAAAAAARRCRRYRGAAARRRHRERTGPGPSSTALGREATRALLGEAPAAYRTQVNDLLLAALAAGLRALDGSRHRRDPPALRPRGARPRGDRARPRPVAHRGLVHDDLPRRRSRPTRPPGPARFSARSRRRCAPFRGAASATGCCATSAARRPRRSPRTPPPEVAFNYLGQLDGALGAAARWRAGAGAGRAGAEPARASAPRASRSTPGCSTASCGWSGPTAPPATPAATIERLAARLRRPARAV